MSEQVDTAILSALLNGEITLRVAKQLRSRPIDFVRDFIAKSGALRVGAGARVEMMGTGRRGR